MGKACVDAHKRDSDSSSKKSGCRCFLITILTLALLGLIIVSAGLMYKYKYGTMPAFLKSRAMLEVPVQVDAVRPTVAVHRARALRRLAAGGARITAEEVLSWYPNKADELLKRL